MKKNSIRIVLNSLPNILQILVKGNTCMSQIMGLQFRIMLYIIYFSVPYLQGYLQELNFPSTTTGFDSALCVCNKVLDM